MVTGWLPWCTPELAETTTIARLELALEGKLDFIRRTNPFGSGEKSDDEKLAEQVDDPGRAAQQLMAFVKRKQAFDARQKRKR